ncbi:hypothetical protein PM082_000760 [Marasmius tenuissimus]|nr:hypothetical protein PM082_000760 [Marasmius tenuissimus]
MSYRFTPSELPNPYLLTAPENMEYLEKKEAEFQAAKAAAANSKSIGTSKKSGTSRKRKQKEPEPSHDSDAENKPVKKSRKTAKKGGKDTEKATSTTSASASSSSSNPVDLFSIVLDDEEEGQVEIYDSCDEIRRKILDHLDTTGCTKAAFLRDIARAGYGHVTSQIKIQSKQLNDFLEKDGATAGSTSRVFYGSYVYFEKKRLAEGQPKSDHRLDMEDAWEGQGGLPRERPQAYIIGADSVLVQSDVGRFMSVPGHFYN